MMIKFRRIAIVSCLCLVFLAGCAARQKKVAPPEESTILQESTIYQEPLPYPVGTGKPDGKDSYPENVEQPKKEITFFENDQPGDTIAKVQGPLPSINYVNDRIFEYGRKLNRWKEIDSQSAALKLSPEDSANLVNCFVDLQKVLDGYNRLRTDMLQLNTRGSSIIISSEDVLDLQKSDVSFLESVCGGMLAQGKDKMIDWQQREESTDLPQLEALIERYTESREYEEVVQVWQRIPVQQIDRVHLRTKILYGNALMFLHQEEKAAEMYQQIVDEMSVSDEQRTDLLSLRKVLADLYTASGNYLAAQNQYLFISKDYKNLGSIEEWSKLQLDILDRSEEGSPELKDYSNLLRNYLGFIPERDGYKIVWEADKFLQDHPYSAVASNVDIVKSDSKARADKWFNGFFEEVEKLSSEKKFTDAIEKLEGIPEDIVSIEQKDTIKARNDDLILAEAVERETRKIEKMQELQSRWNDGMLKVEAGNYEEAIAIFKTLLQTEYFAKANDKINDITLLAAKTDRRAAADLYIRYTKTSDNEMKRKLLTESRRLLTDILVKYPEVSIIDKVKGNIERVEQEMNSLDPLLLPSIRAAELGNTQSIEPVQTDPDFAFSNSVEERPVKEEGLEEKDITQ